MTESAEVMDALSLNALDKHPRSHPDAADATKAMYKRDIAVRAAEQVTMSRISTFEEFWPFYVREHSKKTTRTIHFVGTSAVMGLLAYAAVRRKVWPLLVAPLVGYGPAWFSHFFIEGNTPATFKYPSWSLRADFVMWSKIARGTMDEEVARILNTDDTPQTPAVDTERAHAPS